MNSSAIKHWLPVIICATTIFLFSSSPYPYNLLPEAWRAQHPIPQVSNISLTELIGQIMHFFEYAILAFLLSRAIYHDKTITHKGFLIVLVLTMFYAFSDEIHQIYVPGRTFQLFDLFIDSLGAITGSIIFIRMIDKLEH